MPDLLIAVFVAAVLIGVGGTVWVEDWHRRRLKRRIQDVAVRARERGQR